VAGLPGELLGTLNVPEMRPLVDEVNDNVSVQLDCGPTLVPQLLLTLKPEEAVIVPRVEAAVPTL
jgi:hypothetical protein